MPRRGLHPSVAILTAALVCLIMPSVPTGAKEADPCPEPNDQFQQACALAPGNSAVGYLFHPRDVDAYRIMVLDFGATIRLELAAAPFAYRIELADWNGVVVSSSTGGVLEKTVASPGVYYAFVWSPTGEFSDNAPYQMVPQISYDLGEPPRVLFSNDFRGVPDRRTEDDVASHEWSGGRYTVTILADRGDSDGLEVREVVQDLALRDFTWTFDTRVRDASGGSGTASDRYATYAAYFREVARDDEQRVGSEAHFNVILKDGRTWFYLTFLFPKPGIRRDSAVYVNSSSVLNMEGGVNRSVIRASGGDIRGYINGKEIARFNDPDPQTGALSFYVYASGGMSFHFDNILVTTPGSAP